MNRRNVWNISSSVAEKERKIQREYVRSVAVKCLFSSLVGMEKNNPREPGCIFCRHLLCSSYLHDL